MVIASAASIVKIQKYVHASSISQPSLSSPLEDQPNHPKFFLDLEPPLGRKSWFFLWVVTSTKTPLICLYVNLLMSVLTILLRPIFELCLASFL
ncbi:hypothetical protein VNO77_03031 [Canavalia gladiata]|uniref:Uncharacterized protein n=1 Tax=Canavalia gladiata TaxID=3824 RepID=A0AAN9RBU6_CANGL